MSATNEEKFGIRAALHQANMLMKTWMPPGSHHEQLSRYELLAVESERAANAVTVLVEDDNPIDPFFRSIRIFLSQLPPPSAQAVSDEITSLFESHLAPIPIKDFLSGLPALRLKKNQLEPVLIAFIPEAIRLRLPIKDFLLGLADLHLDKNQLEQVLNAYIPEAIQIPVSETARPADFVNLCNAVMSESPWNLNILTLWLNTFKTICLSFKDQSLKSNEFYQAIETFIKSAAKRIASGYCDIELLKQFRVLDEVFVSNCDIVSPRSQALYVALLNLIGALTPVLEAPSDTFSQVRLPQWCLDALFGVTVCSLLQFPAFTTHATIGIGWCDVRMASASARMPPVAASVFALISQLPELLRIEIQSIGEKLHMPVSAVNDAVEFLSARCHVVRRTGNLVFIDKQFCDISDQSTQRIDALLTEPAQMPPVQNGKILSLMFEMLKLVNEAKEPLVEHDLVEKVLQQVQQQHEDLSFVDAATALHELRCGSVLRNEGTFIVRDDLKGQQAPLFKSWLQPQTSHLGDCVMRMTVFVPDETVFASQEVLPWAWDTKVWKSKNEVNHYFEQLISDMADVTKHSFMAVGQALYQSLGSIPHSMLILLNATSTVEPCNEPCSLQILSECDAIVLKCPSCQKFCICLACLKCMHQPGKLSDEYKESVRQTDMVETLPMQASEANMMPTFDHQKHIVDEFKWLYCCSGCGSLYPPSFFKYLTANISDENTKEQILKRMALAVSRHVRYSEDPVQEPVMFACRSAQCSHFVSSSSHIQMVREL